MAHWSIQTFRNPSETDTISMFPTILVVQRELFALIHQESSVITYKLRFLVVKCSCVAISINIFTSSCVILPPSRQTQVSLPVVLGQTTTTVSHYPRTTHNLRQLVTCKQHFLSAFTEGDKIHFNKTHQFTSTYPYNLENRAHFYLGSFNSPGGEF